MAKLGERELEYFKNPEFLNQYIQILTSRLIYKNNLMEEDNGPIEKLYDTRNISILNDNLNAFNLLFNRINSNNNQLTEDLIIKVANTINTHSMYISNGYRTIGNDVKFENKYSIEKSDNIPDAMKNLLDKYYNEWSKLDIFEREALFNIEFLRIHPFEDGNGRTSRLILNYNIIRQGHAPIIIPTNIREEYFHARNTKNLDFIKKLFEEESKKELYAINILIDDYEKFKKNNMSSKNL